MLTIHDLGVALIGAGVACVFIAAWHWAASVLDPPPPTFNRDDF